MVNNEISLLNVLDEMNVSLSQFNEFLEQFEVRYKIPNLMPVIGAKDLMLFINVANQLDSVPVNEAALANEQSINKEHYDFYFSNVELYGQNEYFGNGTEAGFYAQEKMIGTARVLHFQVLPNNQLKLALFVQGDVPKSLDKSYLELYRVPVHSLIIESKELFVNDSEAKEIRNFFNSKKIKDCDDVSKKEILSYYKLIKGLIRTCYASEIDKRGLAVEITKDLEKVDGAKLSENTVRSILKEVVEEVGN